MLLIRPLLPLLFLLGGCSGDDDTSSDAASTCSGFVGDRAASPEIEIMVLGPDGQPFAPTDGARVPMWKAPQGGKHIFAGVRARNLDTCPISLTGAVRDPQSMTTRFEGRPVQFVDGGDGWAYAKDPTQISSYANINVCPNQWSSKDVFEQTYQLEISVLDKGRRSAKKTMNIVPFCSQPELLAECMCECREGYVLGQCN